MTDTTGTTDTTDSTNTANTPPKQKKGFALNPSGINRGGRPKGSRNKKTLLVAQLELDGASGQAVEFLIALMKNDTTKLGVTENVPIAIRRDAAKEILNKAIANEREKPVETTQPEGTKEKPKPLFSAVPVQMVANDKP